jgi:hypothetical protein
VIGEKLEQHRVRHLAVEDHNPLGASFERIDAGLDLGAPSSDKGADFLPTETGLRG